MLISIVIPMYNESEGVDEFHYNVLLPSLKKAIKSSYEVIYINDGSRDKTLKKLSAIAAKNKKVKVVNLSRNFGKEIATTTGIHIASGDAILIMDGDGQHPPDLITEFIDKWKNGAQVVVGIRSSNQKEGLIKKYGSKMFYKLFNSASGSEIIPRSTDYRLIDSTVRDEFVKFAETHRITRGLIDWLGFERDYIEFDSPARIAGEASYKTSQLIRLAMNTFISLSLKPLYYIGWMGLTITLLSILFGVFIVTEQFILGDPLLLHFSGSAILGIFVSFMVGLVMVSQAIIAVYISHIHVQSQNRPLFVIDRKKSIGLTEQ